MNGHVKKSSMFTVNLIIGAVLLVWFLMALVVWFVVSQPRFAVVPRPDVAPEDRRAELRAAFQGKPKIDDPALHKLLQKLLDDLGRDWQNKNEARLVDYFDFDRMMDELCTAANQPLLTRQERPLWVADYKRTWGRVLLEDYTGWSETEIRDVKRTPGKIEAVVTARHFDALTGAPLRMRWWVNGESGSWYIFDFEDLDMNWRRSSRDGAIMAAKQELTPPAWLKHSSFPGKISQAIRKKNHNDAKRQLTAIKHVVFPNHLEAYRWLYHGLIALQERKYNDALKYFDKAGRFNPELHIIYIDRAFALRQLFRHEEALKELSKYVDLLGEDHDTALSRGISLARLNRREEAAEVLRLSLKYDPEGTNALNELRRILPKEKKQEIVEHFQRMKNPIQEYGVLASEALLDYDGPGLKALASAMRELQPKDSEPVYHLARAAGMKQQWEVALPLYRQALKMRPAQVRRQEYTREMLRDFRSAGKMLEGYQLADDKVLAFETLARDLVLFRDNKQMRQLIEAHEKKHPREPLLAYYRAELAVDKGDYEMADEWYAKVDASKLKPADRDKLLRRHVYTRYKLGKGLSAYRNLKPQHKVFQELARLYSRLPKKSKLNALVKLYAKDHPNDHEILVWRAELQWSNKDYDGLIQTISKERAYLLGHVREGYKLRERFFISLYELKKDTQAKQEIEKLIKKNGDRAWPQLQSVFYSLKRLKNNQTALKFASACDSAAPDHPDALMLLARAKIFTGKTAEAHSLFQRACWKQKNDNIARGYSSAFAFAMVDAGKAVEGYKAIKDDPTNFTMIAEDLLDADKQEMLAPLLAEHRKHYPDDIWLPYYEAELAISAEEFKRAEQLLIAALPKVSKVNDRQRFRRIIAHAKFHTEGAVAAYEYAGKGNSAFNQLTWLCTKPEHAPQLEKLIAAHRGHSPDDKWLPLWEVEAKWIAKDYAATVKCLEKHRDAILAEKNQAWKFRDRLIRSLVRLKQFDKAKAELAKLEQDQRPNLLLHAVIPAAAGDVDAAGRALTRCREQFYSNSTLYNDPDLGAALRGERLQKLREEYPEPEDTRKKNRS